MDRIILLDSSMGIIPKRDVRERFPDETIEQFEGVTGSQYEDTRTVLITGNRWWDSDYLHALDAGDWVTTIGAGYDEFPIDTFADEGIVFSTSRGLNAPQVADHAFAMALAVARNIPTYHEQQHDRAWDIKPQGMTHFAEETCAILGLGHIGEAVSTRANAFGMEVHGVKRDVASYTGTANEVSDPEQLSDAFDGARLLVISVPHTPDTAGMVGSDELAMLADDAIVVNVARGPVLETDALLAALDADEIRAACLDVTDPEPLPEDHALWTRDDVLITPHCAGATDGYAEQYLDFFASQFERWVEGEDVQQQIT